MTEPQNGNAGSQAGVTVASLQERQGGGSSSLYNPEVKQSQIADMMALLRSRWPGAFPPIGSLPRVLKIGTKEAISREAPEIDPLILQAALKDYTFSAAYLTRSCHVGMAIVGLDGRPVAIVDEDHAQRAQEKLAQFLKTQRRAKRKAEKLAREQRAGARGRSVLKLKVGGGSR